MFESLSVQICMSLSFRKKTFVDNSFRYADKASINDDILIQENDDFAPVKVIDVSNQVIQGDPLQSSMCS